MQGPGHSGTEKGQLVDVVQVLGRAQVGTLKLLGQQATEARRARRDREMLVCRYRQEGHDKAC